MSEHLKEPVREPLAKDPVSDPVSDPLAKTPAVEGTGSHQAMVAEEVAGGTGHGHGTGGVPLSGRGRTVRWLADAGFFRILGLVIALVVLCVVGAVTAGSDFADVDNALTILRGAAVVGVLSVGMTFVITGGGIDLSVGAILALSSVWCTTVATQTMARDTHWVVMVGAALAVGAGCGLINGLLVAYGKIVPFVATLAMLIAARGLAEILSDKKTQIIDVPGFSDVFGSELFGIDFSIYLFFAVAAIGWVILNRTTFGRRTFAVGGNPEAARLAGINVQRHTVLLYVLVGVCCGIAALMLVARTTTGTSTHGTLIELDVIAAVVIGGTLLAGGRGTITGTVLGVLIFTTLTNVFIQNERDSSEQSVLKGAVIVAAVLLQQWLASRRTTT